MIWAYWQPLRRALQLMPPLNDSFFSLAAQYYSAWACRCISDFSCYISQSPCIDNPRLQCPDNLISGLLCTRFRCVWGRRVMHNRTPSSALLRIALWIAKPPVCTASHPRAPAYTIQPRAHHVQGCQKHISQLELRKRMP